MKLICLHCAGGSSNLFRKWKFKGIEIIPIDLPGRGKNICLPMINTFIEAKTFVENEISKEISNNERWAIFGHSMGAYIAYEITKDVINKPDLLILSGINLFEKSGTLSILENDDYELINNLGYIGGIPQNMIDNKYFVEWFAPLIRCDLEVVNTYVYSENTKVVNIPTIVINSSDDALIDSEDSEKWKRYFEVFDYKLIQGDHFSVYGQALLIYKLLYDFRN